MLLCEDTMAGPGSGSCVCVYAELGVAVVTVPVSAFDVATDWLAVRGFLQQEVDVGTITLGVMCGLASLLLTLDLLACGALVRRAQGQQAPCTLAVPRELLAFLVLGVEDLPVLVTMARAYSHAPCPLYSHLFREHVTAYVTVLGSFISALWKVVMAAVRCGGPCCCGGDHTTPRPLWLFRWMHLLLAGGLCGYTAYLFLTFSNVEGHRPDCGNTTLLSDIIAP